jgi:hypothetical protein
VHAPNQSLKCDVALSLGVQQVVSVVGDPRRRGEANTRRRGLCTSVTESAAFTKPSGARFSVPRRTSVRRLAVG